MRKLFSVLFSTLQGGVRGGLLFVALLATTTVFGQEYYGPISVTDGTAADWDALPAEYVASAMHRDGCSYDGLKSVKVYCDDNYLNILVEVNLEVVTDLEWTPFHILLNADGSAETGGDYGDFADADSEWLFETAIYQDGAVVPYNPGVFKWWGKVGETGWEWTDPNVGHDQYDCWGAVVCENSDPAVGDAQMVDGDLSKVEIQILKERIPAQWADEFTIGFDIQQSWTSVGVLPNAPDDKYGEKNRAEKLKVKANIVPRDGRCGHKLVWKYEDSQLTIFGEGDMYDYDVDAQPWQQYRNKITTISLPEGMTSVGNASFKDCMFVNHVSLPASVETIGFSAFENCRMLSNLTFAANGALTTIDNWAFYNNHELKNVVIPEGVTCIGYAAFYGCTYLSELTLPASMQAIEDNGFALCAKLRRMNVDALVPPTVATRTFEEVDRSIPVYVPDEVVDIYKAAPVWQEFNIQGKSNAPTGIENNHSPSPMTNCQKVIHNGQLYILRDGKTYNVMGQEL